jgi:hypothetical protein
MYLFSMLKNAGDGTISTTISTLPNQTDKRKEDFGLESWHAKALYK